MGYEIVYIYNNRIHHLTVHEHNYKKIYLKIYIDFMGGWEGILT